MTIARYWRLNCETSVGGRYLSLCEVAFIDEDEVDLSTGGTATASSSYIDGGYHQPDTAFDKNPATWWQSVSYALPAYIQYDHGTAVDVAGVKILGTTPEHLPRSFKELTLQHSSDGTTWSDPIPLIPKEGTISELYYCILKFWDGEFNTNLADEISISGTARPLVLNTGGFNVEGKLWVDVESGGNGMIYGTVKEKGSPSDIPLRRRVRLYLEKDGRIVRQTWSDPVTGEYTFNSLKPGVRYTVIAYDHTETYEPLAVDRVVPV